MASLSWKDIKHKSSPERMEAMRLSAAKAVEAAGLTNASANEMPPLEINPPHPGVVLKECLEDTQALTTDQFARKIGIASVELQRVLDQKAPITPDLSVRLASAFGEPTSAIWLNMQRYYDAWHALNPDGFPEPSPRRRHETPHPA